MATKVWRGDAQPIAQVDKITFANLEEGDTITVAINRKELTYTIALASGVTSSAQTLEDAAVQGVVSLIGQYNNAIAEFREVSAAAGYENDAGLVIDRVIVTGPTSGKPFTMTTSAADASSFTLSVTQTTPAQVGQNEKQQIDLADGVSGGTFTLSYNGVASGNIAWNANAATVEAAIEGIAGVGAGQATTTGTGPWVVEFTGTFAQTDALALVGDGTNLTGTLAITSSEVTKGRTGQNAKWTATPIGTSNFGFFVQEDGTDPVTSRLWSGYFASTDSAATMQTALEGLSNVGTGNVTVAKSAAGVFTIEFIGALARVAFTLDTGGVTTQVTMAESQEADSTVVAEVQDVAVPIATGGTFALSFDGQTTAAIAYNATAATVEAALELLSTIGAGNIDLTESATPGFTTYQCTFAGTLTGVDQSTITGSGASLTGATVYSDVVQAAQAPINEVQTIAFDAAPSGGTFTITYDGQTTAATAYNAATATVETNLEALSNIDAVAVSGAAGGPWVVEFQGTLAGTDVDLMTTDGASLTGADTQTSTLGAVTTPSSPNHYDVADNWHNPAAPSTPTVPAAGDTVIFRDNSVSCQYGLDGNSGDTLAAVFVEASYTGEIGLPTRNDDYFEYRDTNLQAGITSLIVGKGEGSGSPMLRFDLEAVNSTVEVYRTGSSSTDLPAMIYKGGGASTALIVHRGDVGVAVEQGADTANCTALTMSYIDSQDRDATVWLGDGCGTVVTLTKSGGSLLIEDVVVTTLNQTGGETRVDGNETITTAKIDAGTLVYEGDGIITTLIVGADGDADFSRVQQSRTVTNCSIYAGSTLTDTHSTVTWTNGVSLIRCGFGDVTLDIGTHKDITIANGS